MTSKKPVFFDATGRRAARLTALGWATALIGTVLAVGFIASLVVAKPVATVDFPGRTYSSAPRDLVKKAVAPGLLRSAVRLDRGPESQAGSQTPAPAARQCTVAGAARHPVASE